MADVTRRDFVADAALAGAAIAAGAGLSLTDAASASEAINQIPEEVDEEAIEQWFETISSGPAPRSEYTGTIAVADVPAEWDQEADLVVVGFGACGGAAAITAADAGASVVVLEKMDKLYAGGDTSIFAGFTDLASVGGSTMTIDNVVGASLFMISKDQAKEYLPYEHRFKEFEDKLEGLEYGFFGAQEYVKIPNSDQVGANGWVWYDALVKAVEDRAENITVMYETPAMAIVRDPASGEVLGVKAGAPDAPIYVKGIHGVLIATGGYESDPQLFRGTHMPSYPSPIQGNPANTGDGLKMLLQAGAKYTYVNRTMEHGAIAFRKASEDAGTSIDFGQGNGFHEFTNGYLVVNKDGKRFSNEAEILVHWKSQGSDPWMDTEGDFTKPVEELGYRNLPAFLIVDQETFDSGPLGRVAGDYGYCFNVGNPHRPARYEWSEDNEDEVENGYLVKADTIEELCALLSDTDVAGIPHSPDPENTLATIAAFNETIATGGEDEFGRALGDMAPISEEGPYYGASVVLDNIYTCGGADVDAKSQVLDWNDAPIPRLFAGGCVASCTNYRTPCVHGAVAMGIAAAETALALEPQA